MKQKKTKCPKCHNILTISGNPGETIKITCPSCGTSGKVTFEKDEGSRSQKNMVVLKELTKRYKQLLALDNVSIEIKEGEIFGYIGPNGAGKTTTIKIMVDLIKKTSGETFIDGYPMPEQKEEVHKLIGYLPQQVAFQQWRTVNQALTTFGKLSGMNPQEIERSIVELLDLLKLSDVRYKKIVELSGGMIQKLGLVQALLHKPKLLILDEPLSGLDPESRYQVKQILKDMSKQGTTVFFSSHILSDVQDIATKIGILNWGHIVTIGTMEELKEKLIKENKVEIVLSKNSGKWTKLRSQSGIKKIKEIAPDKLLVHFESKDKSGEIIHQLIEGLLSNDCHIRSITPVVPNLDEVYQQYLNGGGNT